MLDNPMLPLIFALPILGAMAVYDLREMRIPNKISLALVALFVILVPWSMPMAETLTRVAAAGVVFLLGFLGFGLRVIGGGDVKALSALMLLVPLKALSLFMLAFAVTLVLGVVAVLGTRRLVAGKEASWAFLQTDRFPMGISIASAGMLLPLLVSLG